MFMSYEQSKDRYIAQMLYYVNKGRLTYIATCIQYGLDKPQDSWKIAQAAISNK
jgi:hypothetical protein